MGYRTYVEDTQIFGSNERYKKWLDFISTQGVEVDEEGNYDGYITDIQGAVEVIEEIILDMTKERIDANMGNIFDLTDIYDEEIEARSNNDYSNDFTYRLSELTNYGYIFMSNSFLKACGDKVIEKIAFNGKTERSVYYRLVNDKVKIHVKAD